MGDLVQSLPLFKRLKEEKSSCEITLLCIKESIEIIQGSPLVDRLVPVPYSYFKKIYNLDRPSRELDFILNLPELGENYDLVINLTHDSSSALICSGLRSKKKSGRIFTAQEGVSLLGDWGKYLFSVVENRTENLINLVDIHIGMGGIPHEAMGNWLHVGTGEEKAADEILCANGWKRSGRLVAFEMGANKLHRAWPVDRFAELGTALMRHKELRIVLLGGPGESALGEEFLRQAGVPAINLIGKTRVTDLPAVLKKCDLLISNDTGTAHVASAVGTRVLGLYFSTAFFGETAPFGPGHVVLQVETPCSPCMGGGCEEIWCRDYLVVEAVKGAAEMMLLGRRGDRSLPKLPNLSIYESRFLSNGTLIYAPATSTISEGYLTGFINRILWESALGLRHDEAFISGLWRELIVLEACRSKMEQYRKQYEFLSSRYHQGLKSLYSTGLTGRGPLAGEAAQRVVETLRGSVADIAGMGKSLMHSFHNYEMMDTDCTNSLEGECGLIGKYSKLYGLVNSFVRILGS